MQIIPLYRYKHSEGHISVSPIKPEGAFTVLYRLVAEEGHLITNGVVAAACMDVESAEGWTEIPEPEEEETIPGESYGEMIPLTDLESAYRNGVNSI